MKKKFKFLVFLATLLCLVSCTSFNKKSEYIKYNFELQESLERILVPQEIKQFEAMQLLGTPTVLSTLKNGLIRTSYYNGIFWLKNSDENKKILKDYITEYFIENEEKFKDIVLALYYYKVGDEWYIYSIKVEHLRRYQ